MTTVPWMCRVSNALRMASTAAWSERFFSPRPISRAAAIAASSVTRTTSSARLRSMDVLLPGGGPYRDPSSEATVPSALSGAPRDESSGGGRRSGHQRRHPVGKTRRPAVLAQAGVEGAAGAQHGGLPLAGDLVTEGERHPGDRRHLE